MSWTTVIWSMGSGICLVLAGVHLLVWLKSRDSWANLSFAIATLSAVAVSLIELAMMNAHTPEEYGELLRWLHVPLCPLVISLAWFVRFYLRTGRLWLIWLICSMRLLLLLLNFLMPPVINFIEITDLQQFPFLGEMVVLPVGKTNPWSNLAEGSGLLLLLFVVDAGIAAWHRGDRRQAWTVGGSICAASLLGVFLSVNLDMNLVPVPFNLTMVYLIIVLGLAFELSVNLIHEKQLTKKLLISEDRMHLAARAANLGLWEWDVIRDEIWFADTVRPRMALGKSEHLNLDQFLQSLHPDDREATRSRVHQALEGGQEYEAEFRSISSGEVRWIAARGQVERDVNQKPLVLRGVTLDITERKRNEEALQRSEQLARTLLNTTSSMTHLLDEEGTILDLNDAMARGLGGTREELIGTNVFDRFTRKSAERRREQLRRTVLEQKFMRFEDQDAEGNKIFDTIIFPVAALEGEKQQFVVFAHDITDIRKMEVAYRESMESYKAIVESFDGFIYICSQDNRIEFMNRRLIDRTGRNAVGEPCYEVLHERDSTCEWCVNDKIFQGETVRREVQSPKDHRWYYVVNTPIRHVDGTISKQSMIMDITDRKEAEVALRKSEKALQQAQRIAGIGNWELDLMTNQFAWSDEIFRIFEIDKEQLGASYEDFLATIHPEDRDAVNEAYTRSLENRESFSISHRLLLQDGRIKHVQERCETGYNPEGQPLRSVGTVQDITELMNARNERRELRHELAHLNRVMTMNELSASLAHEINQPLGAIMNNVAAARTICSKSGQCNGDILQILGDVLNDANRAGQIVRKIRGIVKKEDPLFEPELVNVKAMVNDVLALLHNTFELAGIDVQVDCPSHLPPVRGDRIRLQQVMVNLMANAAEAMEDCAEKSLALRLALPSHEEIIVHVSDSGPGIDPDIREHLFEPFRTTKDGGLGIGLRICRSILEEHDGRIWLENSTSEGTTFSFTLKVQQEVHDG